MCAFASVFAPRLCLCVCTGLVAIRLHATCVRTSPRGDCGGRSCVPRNRQPVYDTLATMSEAMGPDVLGVPEHAAKLTDPLMRVLAACDDGAPELLPLLECVACVAQGLGPAVESVAPALYERCFRLLESRMEEVRGWFAWSGVCLWCGVCVGVRAVAVCHTPVARPRLCSALQCCRALRGAVLCPGC